jgi:hypothetical protein
LQNTEKYFGLINYKILAIVLQPAVFHCQVKQPTFQPWKEMQAFRELAATIFSVVVRELNWRPLPQDLSASVPL